MKNDNARYIPAVRPGTPISDTDAWKSTRQLVMYYPMMEPVSSHLRNICPGWVPLLWCYGAKLTQLLAQSGNGEFVLRSLTSTPAGFVIDTSGSSAAIDGLTRKYQEKSRYTCAYCGSAGKPYEVEPSKRWPLCPRCAAPYLLIDDLSRLNAIAEDAAGPSPFVVPHRIPRTLKPAFDAWASNRPMVRMDSGRLLGPYPWDFVAWVKSLEPLHRKVKTLVTERQKEWRRTSSF